MRVVINTTDLRSQGGVSNHFLGLRDKFSSEVTYFYVGENSENPLFLPFLQFIDFFRFISVVRGRKPEIIHLNPSLGIKAIIRDAGYLLLAKLITNAKIVVFFHGWNAEFSSRITRNYSSLFALIFNNADALIVLSSEFKRTLTHWGIIKPVYIETTKVDDSLVNDLSGPVNHNDGMFNILFMARIIREKGIFETIDTYSILKSKYPKCTLSIAGEGPELEPAKEYVEEKSITDVEFHGYVEGEKKNCLFRNASCYLLPTTHGEGLPTSVVEAMAFGLPVISRPVGGLKDFFENEQMGFLTDSKEPEVFAELIVQLISRPNLTNSIAKFNFNYAQKYFLASKVADRIESIYQDIAK